MTKNHYQRNTAMALDQSALLEVLDACAPPMPVSGSPKPAEVVYQALIDAELTTRSAPPP